MRRSRRLTVHPGRRRRFSASTPRGPVRNVRDTAPPSICGSRIGAPLRHAMKHCGVAPLPRGDGLILCPSAAVVARRRRRVVDRHAARRTQAMTPLRCEPALQPTAAAPGRDDESKHQIQPKDDHRSHSKATGPCVDLKVWTSVGSSAGHPSGQDERGSESTCDDHRPPGCGRTCDLSGRSAMHPRHEPGSHSGDGHTDDCGTGGTDAPAGVNQPGTRIQEGDRWQKGVAPRRHRRLHAPSIHSTGRWP